MRLGAYSAAVSARLEPDGRRVRVQQRPGRVEEEDGVAQDVEHAHEVRAVGRDQVSGVPEAGRLPRA